MRASVPLMHVTQALSQGGFGGCGRTPLFLGPKKKIDGVRVWQRVFRCDRSCTAVGLRTHSPEPNLESVAVSTSNDRHSFECPLSTSSVVFCVDWKGLRQTTNEPCVL